MTRTVRPFADGDLQGFALNGAQERDYAGAWNAATAARLLARGGRAFTLRDHDGTVLMVAGVLRVDESYGTAWAFLSAHSGPRMRWLTGKARGYLDTLMPSHRRIDMLVRADFPQAARWAALLGFAEEGAMPCAATDGADMLRFARVNREWRVSTALDTNGLWDLAA